LGLGLGLGLEVVVALGEEGDHIEVGRRTVARPLHRAVKTPG
jgi:hypothetical protein